MPGSANSDIERQGPLLWGQQLYWWSALQCSESGNLDGNVVLEFALPSNVALEDVRHALTAMVARHETLRTSYRADQPVQVVHRSAPVGIEQVETTGDESVSDAVNATRDQLLRHQFRLDREPPLEPVVVIAPGRAKVLLVATHHIAVDGVSMELLRDEFPALLAARTDGLPDPPAASAQPIELATEQQSEQGKKMNDAALRHWEARLGDLPGWLFPSTPMSPATVAHEIVLDSSSPTVAGRQLGPRCGGAGTVLMTIFGIVLLSATGRVRCSFSTTAANRATKESATVVGSLVQPTPVTVDLTADESFLDLAHQVRTEMLTAYWNGRYDFFEMAGLQQRRSELRGIPWPFPPLFNLHGYGYSGVWNPDAPTRETETEPVPSVNPTTALGELRNTFIFELYPGKRFTKIVLICGANISVEDGRNFVRSFDRMAALVVDDPSLKVEELVDRCGIQPPRPDPRWALLDNCWVDRREVERLVRAHPDVSEAAVFAAPETRGPSALEAWASARGATPTPTDLRTFVLDSLDGQPLAAMAPGKYVVCRRAPDDLQDLEAWQRQEVLREGAP